MDDNKKIKVLVVDDDDLVRNTYVDVFKQAGLEVDSAIDGVEGLDKATKLIPDIILTGIIMPRMDGFALKDALKKNVNTTDIPVFMLSHMGREEDKERAMESGVEDFIIQGITTPRQVVEKIKDIFDTGKYKLKIVSDELDAFKLANDLHLKPGFICDQCGEKMILNVKITDVDKREFTAKLVCPKCGK